MADVEFVAKDLALRTFWRRFRPASTWAPRMRTCYRLPGRPTEVLLGSRDPVDASRGTDARDGRRPDVRYDKEWLDRLQRGVRLLRLIGFALGGALIVAAALTIANVVRLALAARRDELDIMQLVGAPQSYVRGPFIMEGAMHGGLGSFVALVVLAVVFFGSRARFIVPLANALNLSSVRFLSPVLAAGLVTGGLVVGCLAGLVASRRA